METYILNWKKLDPEAKWGLKGKKFTGVMNWSSFLLGGVFCMIFYAVLYPFRQMGDYQMVNMFFHGGPENRSTIPYYTVLLSCWCLAFLLIKWRKLCVQKKALKIRVVPDDPGFIISPMNANEIIKDLNSKVYAPKDFMLLCRVERALGNLKNIGRVSDVSSVLNDLAESDANYMENSYTLPRGLIWAIPVLGFIGTVLGLSQAVGGFGNVVAGGADLDALKNALGGVTGGLATAFETTLIALAAALIIQLILSIIQQKEEDFLDECSNYCYRNITSKLKMIDLREELEEN